MRFIPFKALLALVVLPPILYVAAIQGLEHFMARHYRGEILNHIPGDTQALLAGRARLDDQIEAVVERVVAEVVFLHRGVELAVVVRTQAGRRLYPPVYSESLIPEPVIDPMRVAGENFALLNEGLDVVLTVTIDHNTFVSNSVLALCLMISLTGLVALYRRGNRYYAREEARRQREQAEIRAREEEQKAALATLEAQKENLTADIAAIQSELSAARDRAARNEAELFDEVESLENNLHDTLEQQNQQQQRIHELEDHLARLAREREALTAQQAKAAGGLRKRMETLYKNVAFSDRTLSGLADLPEAMQIKAEEIIHQLNAQADAVPIKRKLFRGKGRETVFEIVFARKGRLYFRRTRDRKVDILAVGTKNTQERDLVHLDRIL